ncbi:MAG TPA: BREX-1 system phosphatase PglZ type A [Candidatus Levilactobacillus faecigallinarum]|uniref:BREX-1 system phosphatase PglZ type A n=1 Tax=Candidatus Levilactobacillus faecigallinarum TaxID=2838638 RepID=A0A9D1QSK4_9LACO|nr:BREX-1 system phosphatase PglZ type A [Candidatus Levilactobacillus faecigallinarum]
MADVDIEQITKTLIERFTQPQQFIFWYDNQGEFQDKLPEIRAALQGVAEVVVLKMGYQLAIKRQLLAFPQNKKALVYSPDPQPALAQDHLRSVMLYSGSFTADSREILRKDLALPVSLRVFINDHMKFFDSKERRQRFSTYDLQSYLVVPEFAIMAAVARLKQPLVDFFDILQLVLDAGVDDNAILRNFERYQVADRFWLELKTRFGYASDTPNLPDFVIGLYLTTAYQQMRQSFPTNLSKYDFSHNLANVQTLVQQFSSRNQGKQPDHFKQLAQYVWQTVDGRRIFADTKIENIAKADVFPQFDKMLLLWIQERLTLTDVDSQLNGRSIGEFTKWRSDNTHYGKAEYQKLYQMMRKAWYLVRDLRSVSFDNQSQAKLLNEYITKGYRTDTDYRKFIRNYREIENPDPYVSTKALVDGTYVNKFLNEGISAWTQQLDFNSIDPVHLQQNFYKNHISAEQNRIVVIISDAFRFEAAKELEKQLGQSDQVKDLKMDYLVTGLPSVTYMGMPAMLPHRTLNLVDKTLRVDGQPAVNREQRQAILQAQNTNSAAYALDDLKSAPSAEIRAKFAGKEVVYIYHNQIDTTADNLKSEDSTFQATDEAIAEIRLMISRLRTLSISHVLVTADHGYLYRDSPLEEADKITIDQTAGEFKSQRYLVTNQDIKKLGIGRQRLGDLLGNDDARYVYYPKTANVFHAPGGVNYVHGGASLQEMLVPLLDVRTTTNRSTAQDVRLELVNASKRITSLTVPVVLRQSEPIGATVIPAEFNLYFVDEQGQQISGLITINANSQSTEVRDRIQHAEIILANRHYDKTAAYYLIIKNKNPQVHDQQKIPFDMDIADLSDFDF